MKSAEEVAGNVVAYLDEHNILLTDTQWAGLRTEIMEALTAFANERVKEAIKNTMDNASEWLPNKTRTEALEEAAKVAKACFDNDQPGFRLIGKGVSDKILALKDAK